MSDTPKSHDIHCAGFRQAWTTCDTAEEWQEGAGVLIVMVCSMPLGVSFIHMGYNDLI